MLISIVYNIIFKFTKDGILSKNELSSTIITLLEDIDGRIISASYDGIRIHDAYNLNKYEVIPGFSDKIFTGVVIDKEKEVADAFQAKRVCFNVNQGQVAIEFFTLVIKIF